MFFLEHFGILTIFLGTKFGVNFGSFWGHFWPPRSGDFWSNYRGFGDLDLSERNFSQFSRKTPFRDVTVWFRVIFAAFRRFKFSFKVWWLLASFDAIYETNFLETYFLSLKTRIENFKILSPLTFVSQNGFWLSPLQILRSFSPFFIELKMQTREGVGWIFWLECI